MQIIQSVPVLPVKDVPKAMAFYETHLGFKRGFVVQGNPPGYATVHRDSAAIHLSLNAAIAGKASCYLVVRGVDAIYEGLKRGGVKFSRVIEDSPYGMRDFNMLDLDGNTIGIGEPVTKSIPPLNPQQVQQFVTDGHKNVDGMKQALEQNPALLNAARDWGGGDWETALGGASHMGRRDIALYLVERGARVDIFAAAMLGWLDFVKSILASQPAARNAPGPHGMPLMRHAKAGGDAAIKVVEYLQSQGK